RRRGNYWLLYRYVGREYILSFIVAFLFFFFIFFVNQILVLAQKILLKNVRVMDVIMLVIFSIPQFLMYTMPFSSLASASMVIGNLSSQNEILALRSSGVHVRNIFMPILIISLGFSAATLMIADRMIPYTTELYKDLYAKILQSVPTLELESYSSTRFGKRIISNGLVDGNTLHDVVIFDDTNSRESRVISATEGSITVIDIDRYLYRIDLVDPEIMITDSSSLESYSLASASNMELYLDLSSSASGFVNITPSQMSIRQLQAAAEERLSEQQSIEKQRQTNISYNAQKLGEALMKIEENEISASMVLNYAEDLSDSLNSQGFSFYYQYYRSELQKKIALSLACTFLVFVAFPISFFKVRNGRLLGFALSMFVACAYWFFIYYMHVRAIKSALHPAVFMWLPNAVVFAAGLILLWRTRK
ncbi:MAG: LptF/LptG family permease, partial [Spirochaetales bacterium]|nr:LptF/LptG family permease [Spirochaetales bacterium]